MGVQTFEHRNDLFISNSALFALHQVEHAVVVRVQAVEDQIPKCQPLLRGQLREDLTFGVAQDRAEAAITPSLEEGLDRNTATHGSVLASFWSTKSRTISSAKKRWYS